MGVFVPKKIVFVIVAVFSLLPKYSVQSAELNSTIHFTNGKSITGLVISDEFSDSVVVMLEGGFRQAYHRSKVARIESLRKHFSIGLGLGLHFGGLGGCIEAEPVKYIGLLVGIGTTLEAGLGWQVGSILYFTDQDSFIRPRISVLYGTNYLLKLDNYYGYGSGSTEKFEGLNVGGGLTIALNDVHSFTFDALYAATSTFFDRKKELENVGYYIEESKIPLALSIGYKFSF
jgi:hypothetical protein